MDVGTDNSRKRGHQMTEDELQQAEAIEQAAYKAVEPIRESHKRTQVDVTDLRHDLDVYTSRAEAQYNYIVEALQRIEGKVDDDHERLVTIKGKLFNGFFDGVNGRINELVGAVSALHVRVDSCEDRGEQADAIGVYRDKQHKRTVGMVAIIGGVVGVAGTVFGVLGATGVL